jgi:hypothetical protein
MYWMAEDPLPVIEWPLHGVSYITPNYRNDEGDRVPWNVGTSTSLNIPGLSQPWCSLRSLFEWCNGYSPFRMTWQPSELHHVSSGWLRRHIQLKANSLWSQARSCLLSIISVNLNVWTDDTFDYNPFVMTGYVTWAKMFPYVLQGPRVPAHREVPQYCTSSSEIQGGSNMTGTNCDLFTHK